MFEHIGKSYRFGRFLQRCAFSAIRNHSHEADHPFTEKDFEIIARFNSQTDALIGEKLLIKHHNPEINPANTC